MILVSAGTVGIPFKRLIDGALQLFQTDTGEKVIFQTGTYDVSSPPPHITVFSEIPFDGMLSYYRNARIIISAAGEASVLLMLRYAKIKPILVPRQATYGEHVDDQQVEVARYFAAQGGVDCVMDMKNIKPMLQERGKENTGRLLAPNQPAGHNLMIRNLTSFVEGNI